MIVATARGSYPEIHMAHRLQSSNVPPWYGPGFTLHGTHLQNEATKLDVAQLVTNQTHFSKHHDPLKWIIGLRQVMRIECTSPPPLELALCPFLLRALTCNVSNLITVVTSTFLLCDALLGFGVLSLTCVAFLALATTFVGLVPAVFRKVTFLREHMTDSILRDHTQIHGDGPDHVVLAMATVRISAAIKMYVSYDREFRSKCSRKEGSGRW